MKTQLIALDKRVNHSNGAAAIVAFTSPFRLILRDSSDCWTATLDQINARTYNYTRLHRLSVSLDIGLPDPLCLHIAYNGSLLLPKISNFWPIEKSVAAFNQALGEILLGGIYFDAVQPTDIDQATLLRTGYFRPHGLAAGLTAQLHVQLQSMVAGPLQSIALFEPRHILAREVYAAHKKGVQIATKISTLRVEFLLHGVSAFVSNDWAAALSHFWTSVEQLISFLWQECVVDKGKQPKTQIDGRSKFLDDHRTWTTAARAELLYQLNAIDEVTYVKLNAARKARNNLVHRGDKPTKQEAEAAIDAAFRLIGAVHTPNAPGSFEPTVTAFKSLDLVGRHYAPPMKPMKVSELEGKGLWLGPFPPIPGENEWGDKEYEQVYPKTA